MKVRFNKEQIEFLKEIVDDEKLVNLISNVTDNVYIELDEDMADDLRDICAQYEIDDIQGHEDSSLSNKGKIAYELINLLYN